MIKQRLGKLASMGSTGMGNTGMAARSPALRNLMVLVLVAAIVTAVVVIALWQSNSQYRPLYGEHEQFDRAQVIAVLEENGMDYYIEPQQGQVMVERSSVGKARMALAAAGVKAQLPTGLEILALDASLGTSQFIENARYRHGLEGELARSIMAIDAVGNVRVHLAIPKQTLFVRRDKEQASASVVISLLPGKHLEPHQVAAIVNLVSGSVTDLPPDRVNVIDQHGNLLSSQEGQGHGGQANAAYLKYRDNLEQTYIDRAAKMLQPMVGLDNFRVEVAAEINFDRTESTVESYAPEGVVRSEFSSYDRKVGKDAKGVPGALSNRPPEEDEEKDPNMQNERGESSRDYLVDRTLKHVKYQQGAMERLSVSVVINGKADSYTPQQLDDIKVMLGNALGLTADRGDSISINVFPFSKADNAAIDANPEWWLQPIWLEYLRYLLSAIVALVILLVVVRPLMRLLKGNNTEAQPLAKAANSKTLPAAKDGKDVDALESETDGEGKSKAKISAEEVVAKAVEAGTISMSPVVERESILADLPSPETGLEVQSSYLQMLSEKEPERVAHVVKQWITPKDADN